MKTIDKFLQEPSPVFTELKELITNEHPVLFDVGSCEGLDSVKYQQMFPHASVFSFEPVPSNVEKIISNSKNYCEGKLNVFSLALSNKTGTASFHVSSGSPEQAPEISDWEFGNKSSSLLLPHKHLAVYPWCQFEKSLEVNTITLQEFCIRHSISHIDFLHLDVQGAELMVLEGARDFIQKISLIWLEVGNVELYKNQPLRKEVKRYMKDKKFTLIKHEGRYISGDQLYIRNDFLASLPKDLKRKYSNASKMIFLQYVKEFMLPVTRRLFPKK